MTAEQIMAVRMWLEYALEGDEYTVRATGLSVNGCIEVALSIIEDEPAGWEAHAAHRAAVAIDDAKRR